jgi:hypothetical protein
VPQLTRLSADKNQLSFTICVHHAIFVSIMQHRLYKAIDGFSIALYGAKQFTHRTTIVYRHLVIQIETKMNRPVSEPNDMLE